MISHKRAAQKAGVSVTGTRGQCLQRIAQQKFALNKAIKKHGFKSNQNLDSKTRLLNSDV